MKSFKEYITESWKKYRAKRAYANVLYKDGIRGEYIEPERFDIGVQYDRGDNKRTYRLAKALERNPNNKDLIDKVDSASLRNLGRVQFRGAKLRGQSPGRGFDQFLDADEYKKNAAAFFDNKSHRELVGTAVDDLASARDWYRFHNIKLKGKYKNERINKFLKNLHASGRIVKSRI